MGRITYFKTALLQLMLIVPILTATSAHTGNHAPTNITASLEILYIPVLMTGEEKDARFMVKAAEIDLLQIRLGIMAQEKGKSKAIKELGKMMEDRHNRSLVALTALAAKKAISIPTKLDDEALADYRTLNNIPAADFDRKYSSMTVKAHKAAIMTYEKASKGSGDNDIRQWASSSLPDLRAHLTQAKACQDKVK
jgi:putative membrane protein